jgi:hypothetical protein
MKLTSHSPADVLGGLRRGAYPRHGVTIFLFMVYLVLVSVSPCLAEGPNFDGLVDGRPTVVASASPRTPQAARHDRPFQPSWYTNGWLSWLGATAGALVVGTIANRFPAITIGKGFLFGTLAGGIGSALAQYFGTGRISFRATLLSGLGAGVGAAGAGITHSLLEGLAAVPICTAIGQLFGSLFPIGPFPLGPEKFD